MIEGVVTPFSIGGLCMNELALQTYWEVADLMQKGRSQQAGNWRWPFLLTISEASPCFL